MKKLHVLSVFSRRYRKMDRQLIMPKRTSYYASKMKIKMNKYEQWHKWVPDASFQRSDKTKMLIRPFPDVLETKYDLKKCCSTKALDQVLDTSDDAKSYPEGPRTYLKKTQTSKCSLTFSSSMIVYDDRL
jgi:hypothetical protein